MNRMGSLLAVDIGLRTGLALYGGDGRLRWYRSKHLAGRGMLAQAVKGWLEEVPDLEMIVAEGGSYREVWKKAATKHGVGFHGVSAERWRGHFFPASVTTNRSLAKRNAKEMARRVIAWSGARAPTVLNDDTAEAILIGLWGVLACRWIERWPDQIPPAPGATLSPPSLID